MNYVSNWLMCLHFEVLVKCSMNGPGQSLSHLGKNGTFYKVQPGSLKIKGVVVAILDIGSVYNGHLDFNVCIDNHTLNRLSNYTGLFIACFYLQKSTV